MTSLMSGPFSLACVHVRLFRAPNVLGGELLSTPPKIAPNRLLLEPLTGSRPLLQPSDVRVCRRQEKSKSWWPLR